MKSLRETPTMNPSEKRNNVGNKNNKKNHAFYYPQGVNRRDSTEIRTGLERQIIRERERTRGRRAPTGAHTHLRETLEDTDISQKAKQKEKTKQKHQAS